MLDTQTKSVGAVGENRSISDCMDRAGVSWIYSDSKQYIHLSSISHPKPLHDNGSLSISIGVRGDPDLFDRNVGKRDDQCGEKSVADELNVDLLVGAKSAEDTLKQYEIDVGIYCAASDSVVQAPSRSLCRAITDDEIARGQERWARLVKSLAGNPISTHSRSQDDSNREDPSSDLTDSEQSVDSDPLPSTPKPKKSYTDVAVKQPSPTPFDNPSTPSSLGAPPPLYTPTSANPVKSCPFNFSWPVPPSIKASTPSPVYTNFSFPSLNSSVQSLPPNLTKDEQGFYTEVTTPPSPAPQEPCFNRATQRPSSVGIQSFLAEPSYRVRKTSKTRSIVDQLRSASANDFDRPHNRGNLPARPLSTPHWMTQDELATPSQSSCQPAADDFEEEGDGWIRAAVGEGEGISDAKTRRTQVLVQALGRNRLDSTPGGESDAKNNRSAGWEVGAGANKKSKPPAADGHSSPSRRKGPRHRSRKSQEKSQVSTSPFSAPSLAPPAALPLSLPPVQPYFSAPSYPAFTNPYPYTAYKPIQMSSESHFFPAHSVYPPDPFGTIMYSSRIQPPSSPIVSVQSIFDRSNIAGASCMTHTQW